MKKRLSNSEIKNRRKLEILKLKKSLGIKRSGVLQAEQVVQAARNEKKYPYLHSYFEWDDGLAACQYRLWQAQHLLVSVQIIARDRKPIQVFVSLESDRKNPGGGYRETEYVLSQKDLREELLQQAWKEFNYWRSKYERIKELSPIFKVADRISKPRKG